MIESATRIRLVAQVREFKSLTELIAQNVAVIATLQIHTEKAINALKCILNAPHALFGQLDRDQCRHCRKTRLHALGLGRVTGDLVIPSHLRISNTQGIHRLLWAQGEDSCGGNGGGKMAQQSRVHVTTLDDPDLGGHPKTTDGF